MVNPLPEQAVLDKKMEETPDIRSLRESCGLTLDDVSKATKISVKNLEAIERSAFHLLPPPIYAKAYFKSYAQLLGVEERLITGPYEKNLTVSARAVEQGIEEVSEGDSFFSWKIIVNVVVVFVLCTLGFFSYIYFNSPEANIALDTALTTNPKGKPVTDSAVSAKPDREVPVDVGSGAEGKTLQTAGTAAAVKSEAPPAATMKSPAEKPILIIVAREKTWLRITEDQKEAYELLMAPGERLERSAEQYNIDVGNAGGISVQFQGNSMNTLGKSGEVVHLRFP